MKRSTAAQKDVDLKKISKELDSLLKFVRDGKVFVDKEDAKSTVWMLIGMLYSIANSFEAAGSKKMSKQATDVGAAALKEFHDLY